MVGADAARRGLDRAAAPAAAGWYARTRRFAGALTLARRGCRRCSSGPEAAVGRVRPWIALGLPAPFGSPHDCSFPSGHAAGGFCVAAFLAVALPVAWPARARAGAGRCVARRSCSRRSSRVVARLPRRALPERRPVGRAARRGVGAIAGGATRRGHRASHDERRAASGWKARRKEAKRRPPCGSRPLLAFTPARPARCSSSPCGGWSAAATRAPARPRASGDGRAAEPRRKTSTLPGVDTSAMTPRERHEFSSLVTELLAPCPNVPVLARPVRAREAPVHAVPPGGQVRSPSAVRERRVRGATSSARSRSASTPPA